MEKDKGKYIMLIFEMVSDTLAVSFTCPLWDIKKHIFCAIAALLQRIPNICHFFTRAKFFENKIYTEKTRKLRQNTQ